jgi:hypothetical protein
MRADQCLNSQGAQALKWLKARKQEPVSKGAARNACGRNARLV